MGLIPSVEGLTRTNANRLQPRGNSVAESFGLELQCQLFPKFLASQLSISDFGLTKTLQLCKHIFFLFICY